MPELTKYFVKEEKKETRHLNNVDINVSLC